MTKILLAFMLATTISIASVMPSKSIVKIFSSVSIPNYQYPWQSNKLFKYSGSGVVLNDHMILTSAHVVSDAKFIQLSKENTSKKYTAKVKFISHQADLAILEVKDKTFFENIEQVKFTEHVKQGDTITVLGYPRGGKSLSTTKGIASRIEPSRYVWSGQTMLSIQIDAPVNSGNSGGVALNEDGEIVGIVMQILKNSNNIAYIVPSIIVNTFLEDIKDGDVDGYDDSNNKTQNLESEILKKYYNFKGDKGISVVDLNKNEKDLKMGDIILSINGEEILSDGTIKTPYGDMNYKYALHLKPASDRVGMKVVRSKKIININYTLKRKQEVIKYEKNKQPRYLIYGGLVFSPLTRNYMYKVKITTSLELAFFDNCRTKHIKEAVIMQYEKFPHDVNSGYTPKAEIVKSINGIKVVDFAHFVKLIDSVDTPYTVVEFIDDSRKIVLDTKKARESFADIKGIYDLSADKRI